MCHNSRDIEEGGALIDTALSPRTPGLGIGVVVTRTRLESPRTHWACAVARSVPGPSRDPEYKEDLTRDGASVTLLPP